MMTKEQIEYLRSLIDANPEAELLVETDDVIALLDEVDRLRAENAAAIAEVTRLREDRDDMEGEVYRATVALIAAQNEKAAAIAELDRCRARYTEVLEALEVSNKAMAALHEAIREAEARGHDVGAGRRAVSDDALVSPKEAVRRGQTARALTDVAAERRRQHAKWGEQNLPDIGGYADTGIIQEPDEIRGYAKIAERMGTLTYTHVLTEEVSEAVYAKTPEERRAELVQVAAVAVQWIEAIDRRGGSK